MKKMFAGLVFVVAFLCSAGSVHAEKSATAYVHLKQPIDDVFNQTVTLANGSSLGLGLNSSIESINDQLHSIKASFMGSGQRFGMIYVMAKPEGQGTLVEIVVSLSAMTFHGPDTYAERFAEALKKTYPDLTLEVKKKNVPDDFAFGPSQVSVPTHGGTSPATTPLPVFDHPAPEAPPMLVPTTVYQPIIINAAPDPGLYDFSRANDIFNMQNSLQQIAFNTSQINMSLTMNSIRTSGYGYTGIPYSHIGSYSSLYTPSYGFSRTYTMGGSYYQIARSSMYSNMHLQQQMQINAMQNNIQTAQAAENFANSLVNLASVLHARSEAKHRVQDITQMRAALMQFVGNAKQTVSRYMDTSYSDAEAKYSQAAQELNDERDAAFRSLGNATQKGMFNEATNNYLITFSRQMSEHASRAAALNLKPAEDPYAKNLHQTLDAWYANGKDWNRIPAENWNKLSERDKGRLKDGIDPELGLQK